MDAHGSEKSGKVDASDERHAGALLRESGLFPTLVKPASMDSVQGGNPKERGRRNALAFGRGIKARELAAFTRQLGTLVDAGMPLLRCLEVLSRQEKNRKMRHVIDALAENIRS
ncbi:MAG TPA: type II secretion system F family protein, partial [Bacteroidia bacterium]|nr:type II secretion system F family protein [Bacteroidia bacterium]